MANNRLSCCGCMCRFTLPLEPGPWQGHKLLGSTGYARRALRSPTYSFDRDCHSSKVLLRMLNLHAELMLTQTALEYMSENKKRTPAATLSTGDLHAFLDWGVQSLRFSFIVASRASCTASEMSVPR